jgi:hypothetical protein
MTERAKLKTHWTILKYDEHGNLVEMLHFEGNILLNAGITELWNLVCGLGSPRAFNSTNARVFVGDGTTTPSPEQNRLQGTNIASRPVDSGYPMVSGKTAIWQATFGPDEANFTWNEAGVANGPNPPTDGVLLNRTVATMGTKQQGSTWILQVRIEAS